MAAMREARWVQADLGNLEPFVDIRLKRLADVVPQIWARDHTVWASDPTEIADRLGWLDAPRRARTLVADLPRFAQEVAERGFTHAILLGMGGSSLAPEVFRQSFGVELGMLDLRVLDSTHPDAIAEVERELPLDTTLFIVSSKSGTTIETRSHMEYFLDQAGDPSRFVAITDPGTPLEADALARGFLRVFGAPADVGGRYSALTEFGLVPAALVGADLEGLLEEAVAAVDACGPGVAAHDNPGAMLGAILGEAALAGRDKLTIEFWGTDDTVAGFGGWIEQLLAESTGKKDRGLLPVDGEPPGVPGWYGSDRVFLGLEPPNDDGISLMGETAHGDPWATLRLEDPPGLGAATFVLEFATAVAGHVLGINPFDQPDVQSAKDRTTEVLQSGQIPEEPEADLDELLGSVRPGDYVAFQAFVAPSPETWEQFQEARFRILERFHVATTLGYGPRYLHSTGQYHKGGPNTGVFIQVFDEPKEDRPIPGRDFTFGRLIAAQAAGDLAALRERGRRAGRVSRDALLSWKG
jgi:transaldolase / glucose-6-phosphate isomerase